MKRLIIFLHILFFAVIANSQILFHPEIDSTSKDIYIFYKEKKINIALQIVNKLISTNPMAGINYFNRAVLQFYNLTFSIRNKTPVSDKKIVQDCIKAIQLGYENSEIYYLLFSQYYNCDPDNKHFFGCRFDTTEDITTRYDQLKKFIDTAIIIYPYNEKYHWTRLYLFSHYEITSEYSFDVHKEDIPTLRSDCEKLIQLTKIKNRKFWAYYYLAEAYKTYYNDTSKAIEYYSAAIDIDPRHNSTYAKRGDLRKDYGNDWEAAIEDYNIYLAREKDSDIFYSRAWCYFSLNRNNDALKDLNSAILLNEEERKNILDSNELALLALDFNEVKWGNAYGLRGLVNFSLKNEKAALKDFNKGIEYGSKLALKTKDDLFGESNQNQDDIQDLQLTDNSIPMVKNGGVYEIPVFINSSLKLNFIFDSGASDVSVSPDVALTLIRTGTVTDKDFIGTATYKFADGSIAKSKIFILKELQIGNKTITNVRASISNSLEAPLLLGQSVLNKFGKVTIDYKNGVIHFEE